LCTQHLIIVARTWQLRKCVYKAINWKKVYTLGSTICDRKLFRSFPSCVIVAGSDFRLNVDSWLYIFTSLISGISFHLPFRIIYSQTFMPRFTVLYSFPLEAWLFGVLLFSVSDCALMSLQPVDWALKCSLHEAYFKWSSSVRTLNFIVKKWFS